MYGKNDAPVILHVKTFKNKEGSLWRGTVDWRETEPGWPVKEAVKSSNQGVTQILSPAIY